MIKTLKTLFSQDKERYAVPRKVQDVIPIRRIWNDGIFLVGSRYAKTFKFTDVNYSVASREEKESMVLTYSELLNSLDSTATTKITINNRGLNRKTFEAEVLMEMFPNYPDVVNVEQLCEMLGGISVKTGYRLLKTGAIKSFVIARRYRIPKINVIEYLEVGEKSDA